MDNGKRATSLALTAATHAMNHAMYNMLTPLAITLSAYFHFNSLSRIGAGTALYLACFGFFQIPVGFLSDRLPRKPILSAGLLLNGIAIAAAASFPSYHVFMACMALAGVGGSAYHPVGAAYLSDLYKEARGKALGISGFGATVGLVFGPIVSGRLGGAFNWRVTLLIFSGVAVAVAVAFQLFAVEPERQKHEASAGERHWTRGIVTFLAIAAAVFTFREFCGWGGYSLVPIYAEKMFKFNLANAGVITGMQSVGGFIAQPLGGYLSDKIGRRWLMVILLMFVAFFMLSIPHVGLHLLWPVVLLYSFAYTATVPIIDALIADRTPPSIRGGVFGIFMATGIGLSSLSPYVITRVLDATGASRAGFNACFAMLGISVLISMTLLLLFRNAENGK